MTKSKQRTRKPRVGSRTEPKQVDISQFSSLDDALDKADPGSRYVVLAERLISSPEGFPMTPLVMFWMSMLARAGSIHGALARELRQENPHAVYPLLRAMAEGAVLVIYVLDHPRYAISVMFTESQIPEGVPRRKTVKALIDHAAKHFPGMTHFYRELSEGTHFGSVAMWAPLSLEDKDTRRFSYSSGPRWKDEQQALVACAQTLEMAAAMEFALRRFAEQHVWPLASTA
jgi:hypothetical protein